MHAKTTKNQWSGTTNEYQKKTFTEEALVSYSRQWHNCLECWVFVVKTPVKISWVVRKVFIPCEFILGKLPLFLHKTRRVYNHLIYG